MALEQELKIDKFSLDEEWLRQPMLIYQWSKDYAEALAVRDKTKQLVELIKAESDLAIRKNPERFGLEKATDKAVENAIITVPEYQEALKQHQQAMYDVNILSGGIEAINHKKSALDNLTRLFLSGYWAEARSASPETRIHLENKVTEEQVKALAQNPRLKKLVRK